MDVEQIKKDYDDMVEFFSKDVSSSMGKVTRMLIGRDPDQSDMFSAEHGQYSRVTDKGIIPAFYRSKEGWLHLVEQQTSDKDFRFFGEWYRPSFEETLKLNDRLRAHVLNGGLVHKVYKTKKKNKIDKKNRKDNKR